MQVKHFESTQNLLSEAMKHFSDYFEPHKITMFKNGCISGTIHSKLLSNLLSQSWKFALQSHNDGLI